MYIYVCIHTYIHICIWYSIHEHTYMHTYIHTYIHTCRERERERERKREREREREREHVRHHVCHNTCIALRVCDDTLSRGSRVNNMVCILRWRADGCTIISVGGCIVTACSVHAAACSRAHTFDARHHQWLDKHVLRFSDLCMGVRPRSGWRCKALQHSVAWPAWCWAEWWLSRVMYPFFPVKILELGQESRPHAPLFHVV